MHSSVTDDLSQPGRPSGPAPSEVAGWDPLGASPLAWDLPDPRPSGPPPRPPRQPKPKVGLVTMGLALMVGAVGFWVASMDGLAGVEPAFVIALMLAVIGLGMVAGSFVRSGRGLVWPAAALSALGLLVAGSGYDGWHGTGDMQYRPATIGAVQQTYQSTAGSVAVDLTALPDSGNVRTTVRNTFGEVRVLVPENADVRAHCHARVGDVRCLQQNKDGVGSDLRSSDDGPDGPGGLKIDLEALTSAGSVEVVRA